MKSHTQLRCWRYSLAFALLACSLPAWADTCRVTTAGTQFGVGTWADPVSLTQALAASNVCTEIWVAKGVYKPTSGANRDISFNVQNSVEMYGGFAGDETLRSQRNAAANLTVLSGDIDNNDVIDAHGVVLDATGIVGSNSIHVIYLDGRSAGPIDASTVIDGFAITAGRADGDNLASYGGGLYCDGFLDCSPRLANLWFSGNTAGSGAAVILDGHGDAIHDIGPNSTSLESITFSGNRTTGQGGAVTVLAAYGNANPSFKNVTFRGNLSEGTGGAIAIDGFSGQATATLTNATFNDNRAISGGAIFAGNANLTLSNVILWGDRVPLGNTGPEMQVNATNTTVDHSIVQGGCPNGVSCTSLLTTDPLLDTLAYHLGPTMTMPPAAGSPAIDGGDDTTCPATDQRDISRPQGAHCDIGAVETFVVDLIGHKGGEACWSHALTKPAFLDLVRAQIDGEASCVPPTITASYTVCNSAACAGGVFGCPVTTRSGTFTDVSGGGALAATGSIDNTVIPVHVISPITYDCQYTANNITLNYVPEYVFTDDGNFGDYSALLNRFAITPSGYTISSADFNCQNFAGTVTPAIVAAAQTALVASIGQRLRDTTLRQSVCPAPP